MFEQQPFTAVCTIGTRGILPHYSGGELVSGLLWWASTHLQGYVRPSARSCCHRRQPKQYPCAARALPLCRRQILHQLWVSRLVPFAAIRSVFPRPAKTSFSQQTYQVVALRRSFQFPPSALSIPHHTLPKYTVTVQCQNAGPPLDCCPGAAPILACSSPRRRYPLAAGAPDSFPQLPLDNFLFLKLTARPFRTRGCTHRKSVSPNSTDRRMRR